MDNPCATRNYEIRSPGSEPVPLRLGIGAPNPVEQDAVCEYEIASSGRPTRAAKAYGVDGIQALLLALMAANVDIVRIAKELGGQVCWLDGDGTGLPRAEQFPAAPVPVDKG